MRGGLPALLHGTRRGRPLADLCRRTMGIREIDHDASERPPVSHTFITVTSPRSCLRCQRSSEGSGLPLLSSDVHHHGLGLGEELAAVVAALAAPAGVADTAERRPQVA